MGATGNGDLLTAFEAATAEDLQAVRAKAEALRRELMALEVIEKALASRFGEAAPPKSQNGHAHATISPSPAPVNRLSMEDRRLAVASLLREQGPKSRQQISELRGIPRQGAGCLAQVLDCPWFHVNPDGMVSLSSKGDQVPSD